MESLSTKHCVPCHGGVPPLAAGEIASLLAQLEGWEVVDGHHLSKSYKFKNFAAGLAFVNFVGGLAEGEGHHPDICLGWDYVRINIHTHAIDGLTESDFILAARIDAA